MNTIDQNENNWNKVTELMDKATMTNASHQT